MNLLEGHADELRGALGQLGALDVPHVLVAYVENALAETGGDER